VNAVALLDTSLSALGLLDALQALEAQAGRERPYVNAPRTLDLDLILYGQSRIESPRLQVPHPRWRERAFVLLPLADVWPDQVSAQDRARVADQPIEVLPEDKA
jgi:2-amino-4-hydroxy-6-hydroxymethyldihydropteridine diphosphokinase